MKTSMPGTLFYFNDLSDASKAVAVASTLKSDRRSLAKHIAEAKLLVSQNVNACVNNKHFIAKILREVKHLKVIEKDVKKAISYIEGNLSEFHADGTYHTHTIKHCEICHKEFLNK